MSWLTLLSDSPLCQNGELKPARLFRQFLSRLQRDGLRSTVMTFSSLAHELVSRHTLMGDNSAIGSWVDGFKDTPVFFEYNRYFNEGNTDLLSFIYTFLNFGKKQEYHDEDFSSTAFRGWLGIEEKLASQSLMCDDVMALKAILRVALPTFTMGPFYPKFGPGSVAERGVRGRIGKVESFQYDGVIDRFLFHGHMGHYGLGQDVGLTPAKVVPTPEHWRPGKRSSSRIARLMFVPKDLKTARSICMEPNTLQYFQQGILRRSIELLDNSLFSKFIKLEDQSRNKSLAEYGSYTAAVDTIDLSSASDCLSYNLFKSVFPPSWQIPYRATRSHSCVLPNGKIHRLAKFAPMGSALCFPTQCILFTGVVVYAHCLFTYEKSPPNCTFSEWLSDEHILESIANFGGRPGYGSSSMAECAVYGDDICVDSRLTGIVMSILDRLGFLVNRQKSFQGGQAFRESCGGYYLNGSDVTPLFYRVHGVRDQLSAEHLASGVSLANAAWLRGYNNLYKFMKRSLLGWDTKHRSPGGVNAIPFIEYGSTAWGLIAPRAYNSHLEKRVHPKWQRSEYKAMSVTYDYRTDSPDASLTGLYDYTRWVGSRAAGNSVADQATLLYDAGGARVCWRWIPATT